MILPVLASAQSAELTRDDVADESIAILQNDSLTLDQRREMLRTIANRFPDVAAGWAAYGEVLHKIGDQELAMASFRKALEIDPSLYSPWMWLGIMYKRGTPSPDYEMAKDAFLKALERGAPVARTRNELAVTLALEGDYKAALEEWRKAVQADPEWGVLYNNLIKAALALGEDEIAERYVQGAITADRFEENAVLIYGEYLVGEDRVRDAARLYQRAIDAHPLNSRLRYYYGTALGMVGEEEEAINQLIAAKRLSKRDEDAVDVPQASDWMIFKIEHPDAEDDFQDARQLVFEQSASERDLRKAAEKLDPLVAAHPDFWNGWFVRGVANRRLNNVAEAKRDLEKVLELHPNEPNATMELALLWRDQFEFDKGAVLAEEAVKLAPRDPVFKVNSAFIMIEAGRCDRAWELYRETIRLIGGENQVTQVLREELEVRCAQ